MSDSAISPACHREWEVPDLPNLPFRNLSILLSEYWSACDPILLTRPVANRGRDFLAMGFEREVARVIEMDFRVRVISPERLGAAGQEERVILPQTASMGGRFMRKYSWNFG